MMSIKEAQSIAAEALRAIAGNEDFYKMKDLIGRELDITDEILDEAVEVLFSQPVDKDKTWPMWTLSPEDIEGVAKEKGLSVTGKDYDEIARITQKGISATLDFVWEEAIENAIRGTKADWKFNIVDRSLSDSSEHRSGNSYELTETWAGEVECKSEGASFVFDFELVHHATEDKGNDTAKITSNKPDVFNEDEWDDLTYAIMDFIETTYRAEHWKE